MAKLIIRHSNEETFNIDLIEGRKFIIGRSRKCDISLKESSLISREHAVLSFVDSHWQVELTSKKGSLLFNGKEVNKCVLKNHDVFTIPPYEIELIIESDKDLLLNLSPSATEVILPNDIPDNDITSSEESSFSNYNYVDEDNTNGEQTKKISLKLEPYFVFTTNNGDILETKLSGSRWIIGRANECDIQVNDPFFSRTQFELRKVKGVYSILDISPSNPTKLNGASIGKNNFKEIFSGDIISVKTTTVEFQERNLALDNVIKANQHLIPITSSEIENLANQPPVIIEPKLNKNKIRIIAISAIVLLLGYFLLSTDQADKKLQKQVDVSEEDKISPTQKKLVTDMYNLAFNYYTSTRFELCLSELKKIHQIIDSFKRSREFEKHCKTGIKTKQLQDDLAKKEREEKRVREEVAFIISNCKKKIDTMTLEQAKDCLSEASELEPESLKIQKIYETIEQKEIERASLKSRQKRNRINATKHKKLYASAAKLKNEEKYKKAIVAFNKVIKFSSPNSSSKKIKKETAKEIKVIEEILKKKLSKIFKKCYQLHLQKEHKKAIIACDSVIKMEPSFEKAHDVRKKSLIQLRVTMRNLYQAAILEESLGDLNAAKEKWKQIIKENYQEDSFYNKARVKLKKYGIEI